MACNSCAKSYTLLRKEKGCPSCGFSYCSKCLNNTVFLPKLKAETKVCAKCKRSLEKTNESKTIEPPDAYYKRISGNKYGSFDNNKESNVGEGSSKDQAILERLQKLKEDNKSSNQCLSDSEIAKRLQNVRGDIPSTTDAELQERLAKLRGVPVSVLQSKPVIITPDLRTEQQQADDLMKQYLAQTDIDNKYKDEFDGLVNDIESRLSKLKGSTEPSAAANIKQVHELESEDEEETIKKIVEKVKVEASLEDDDIAPSRKDELPFCEICNEDARMRCLGCQYLFCKRCFIDHKDDDDGCNNYETYTPPKGYQY